MTSQKGKGKGVPPLLPSCKGKSKGVENNILSEADIRRQELCQALKEVPFFDSSSDERAFHGRAYANRGNVATPRVTWASEKKPREHSAQWLTATEYEDEPSVFKAKVSFLATLLRISHKTIVYSGAGLSVAAGVRMAAIGSPDATKPVAEERLAQDTSQLTTEAVEEIKAEAQVIELSPECGSKGKAGCCGKGKKGPPPVPKQLGKGKPPAKLTPALTTTALPTSLHYAMADLNHRKLLHGWVQQNHDGLPQKAGYPQEDIVEIHGSWYDPSHQVVKYSGSLRDDVYGEMGELANSADLCLVMGTSLTGLTSDMVASKPAIRSQYGRALGTVIISPQRTSEDGKASLRIFSKAELVMQLLVSELGLTPARSVENIFPQELKVVVPYDRHGIRSNIVRILWDLRPGQKVHLGSHHNSQLAKQPDLQHLTWNDEGEVLEMDNENFCIPLRFPPAEGPRGQLEGKVTLKLGLWWLSTAQRGGVARLPVVNANVEEIIVA